MAGVSALGLAQTIGTPIDVISQRVMVSPGYEVGKDTTTSSTARAGAKATSASTADKPRRFFSVSRFRASDAADSRGPKQGIFRGALPRGTVMATIRDVYARQGLQGFYRGYFASILQSGPSSGIWWACYGT